MRPPCAARPHHGGMTYTASTRDRYRLAVWSTTATRGRRRHRRDRLGRRAPRLTTRPSSDAAQQAEQDARPPHGERRAGRARTAPSAPVAAPSERRAPAPVAHPRHDALRHRHQPHVAAVGAGGTVTHADTRSVTSDRAAAQGSAPAAATRIAAAAPAHRRHSPAASHRRPDADERLLTRGRDLDDVRGPRAPRRFVAVRRRRTTWRRPAAWPSEVLRDVDEVCSRFREDSDLSRVNAHPGSWVEVDPLLVAAVTVAVRRRPSDRRSRPPAPRPAAGRSSATTGTSTLSSTSATRARRVRRRPPRDSWEQIDLDPPVPSGSPAGTSLDLGVDRQGVGGGPDRRGLRARARTGPADRERGR